MNLNYVNKCKEQATKNNNNNNIYFDLSCVYKICLTNIDIYMDKS